MQVIFSYLQDLTRLLKQLQYSFEAVFCFSLTNNTAVFRKFSPLV